MEGARRGHGGSMEGVRRGMEGVQRVCREMRGGVVAPSNHKFSG